VGEARYILYLVPPARAAAESVIVSGHSPEPTTARAAPAAFLRRFARAAIDAGALAVVGHGPHRVRGVERYKDGVILYSLGNFLYQSGSVAPGAAGDFDAGTDLYALALGGGAQPGGGPEVSDGVVAELIVEPGQMTDVRLHPIKPEAKGAGIVRNLDLLSREYGTVVTLDGDYGRAMAQIP
jgi:poly-gamma-glutamate synthesis protein (capsule biosynthesis protein)